MFRTNKTLPSVYICSTDKSFTMTVDQFDSQDFNKNEAGWIRNDISQLARAQSLQQFDSLMRRLTQLKAEGNIKEGTSIKDAITQIKPSWAQSPTEIQQFVEMTQPAVMEKLNLAYEQSVKEKQPVVDATVVDAPAVDK